MTDLVVLGTDTDAGKTTFALLWLAAFADAYDYWKPIETGLSDSARVRRMIPSAAVHEPVQRFADPVAPLLAARRVGSSIRSSAEILQARPGATGKRLLIETFGGPFSPLNEHALQIDLIRGLAAECVLVSSTSLGTIGRTLQCLKALASCHVRPACAILVGPADPFAHEQLQRHAVPVPVFALCPPRTWDNAGVSAAAAEQSFELRSIRETLGPTLPSPLQISTLIERDQAAVWHPYTTLRGSDQPLVCVGTQDEFLSLADGRRVIDGISSWWTILHGHRHPALVQALHEAAQQYDHVHFAGVTHEPAVALAELLLASVPWTRESNPASSVGASFQLARPTGSKGKLETCPHIEQPGCWSGTPSGGKVFYSDNGSTAVEVALKMAYQFWCHHGQPQRRRFIGFEHGYHGDTFGAMAVSRDPVFFGRFEPLLFQADILPLDPERLADHLSLHKDEVAGIILEPLVQGAGGMHMHSAEHLREIYEVAKSHDALFIADEVMTGGGRTGWLWAHQAAGIVPDLICVAKTLAGGMLSLAATLAAPHIVAAFDSADRRRTFFHGHSFTAHPLACAVAKVSWELLMAYQQTTEHAGASPVRISPALRMETLWKDALAEARNLREVREVRIRGSIAALELDVGEGYLAEAGPRLRKRCLEAGVLLRPLGNVLYAMPPFCTTQSALERIAEAMSRAVCSESET